MPQARTFIPEIQKCWPDICFILCDMLTGALGRAHFKYHKCRCDQQVGGFYWLTIDALLFAFLVLSAKRQIYLFFMTINIYSVHWAYKIPFISYYECTIFIHCTDKHLNCFKTFTIIHNLIMDTFLLSPCTHM